MKVLFDRLCYSFLKFVHTLGTTFLKFGRRGHPHETYVKLSEDNLYLEWTPSSWGVGLFAKKKEDCRGTRNIYFIS